MCHTNKSPENNDLSSVLAKIRIHPAGKLGIFNCDVPISTYKNVTPIIWKGDWKPFLDFIKSSKINPVYIYSGIDSETGKTIDIEIGCFIEGKYHMVRLGESRPMELLVKRITDSSRSPDALRMIKKMEAKSIKELEEEVLDYILNKNLKDIEDKYETKNITICFMHEKGIPDISISPTFEIKVNKLAELVHKTLTKEKMEKENELIPALVMRCVEWARARNIRTVYDNHIHMFLRELDIDKLSDEGEELLELQVNNSLKTTRK